MKALIGTVIIFSVITLSGCVSSVLTGMQLVYDRQELKKTLDNYHVQGRARRKLTPVLRHARQDRVVVTSFNRDLLLIGQVPSKEEKARFGSLVANTRGVREVFNQIRIEPKASFTQVIKDSWISTKIKTLLLAKNDINHQAFHVITENGIVYLMGDVKPEQAKKAVDLASRVKGVREVVKVFRYYNYTTNIAVKQPVSTVTQKQQL